MRPSSPDRRWRDGWLGTNAHREGRCRAAVGGAIATALRRRPNSRCGGENSMRLGPMASQRGAKIICAHLGQRRAVARAGDGDMARPRLVDGEGGLQWFSNDDEDPKGALDLGEALGLLKGAWHAMIPHDDEKGWKLGFDLAGANSSPSDPYLKAFFVPTHSRHGVLPILSLSRLQIMKDKKDSAWG
jgi:hypothetical protein